MENPNQIQNKLIWTIEHSTRTIIDFINILLSFQIELVADIRSLPGSRRYPHFNKESLEITLPENNIKYIHIAELGGRRKTMPDSINTSWHNDSFRGFADYTETNSFKKAITDLENLALNIKTAYMCSEAVWWRCHRSIVSDFLKIQGWTVIHIMGVGKSELHPYTSPARIVGDQLFYYNE